MCLKGIEKNLKNFFKNNSFKVLLCTLIVMILIFIYSFISGSSILSSIAGLIITPMQQLSNNIAQSASNIIPSNRSIEELEAENARLQKKIDEMVALTIDYYDLKRENEQNIKYLELKERKKDYKFASASVIGRDPTDLFYGFTIDQGSLSDISKYDPVITDKGLIGWVSSVYPTYCKVTTIFSPKTNVSVLDQMSRDSAVTVGSLELADQGFINLQYISAQNSIKPSDIIITSGIGGIYPGELPVGEIVEVFQQEGNAEINAKVKPYEDIKNVRNVFVITEFLGQGDAIPESFTEGVN